MHRIHVYPGWKGNPYLNMLYVGARSAGWSVQPTRDLRRLYGALSNARPGDILHLHWTQPIAQSHRSEAEARRSVNTFRRAVTAAIRDNGVRLVWTVHNQLPHNTRYRDLEIELVEFIARSAWRIIQLNRSTRAAVADFYDLPAEKIVTLRHASYDGIYPPAPPQAAARAVLGVPENSPTIGFVGQIRPYKGITTLLEAAELLADRVPDLTVLLAGRTHEDHLARLDRHLPAGVRVIRDHSFIPDEDLATWFSASDLMVFPYQRVLNSGSLLLSATFGRPCILPDEPHLVAEFADQEWISFFSPEDSPASGLAAAIEANLADVGQRRAAALAFAAEYTTYDMAWDYLRILEEAGPAGRPQR